VRFLRENSLSLFFGAILLASLAGQSVAGLHVYNQDAVEHGQQAISWGRYLVSSEFGGDVLENWQSEFLQFTLYILTTVWLLQRGSSESKELDKAGLMSDEEEQVGAHAKASSPSWAKLRGGFRRFVYSHSLTLLMATIFFLCWFGQSLDGWRSFNNDQEEHKQPKVSWSAYLREADFWDRSLQNWQSEFLAVGSMAVFAIYLRQRGSPESKPVGAAHDETGRTN
jgi:hypothetical protein